MFAEELTNSKVRAEHFLAQVNVSGFCRVDPPPRDHSHFTLASEIEFYSLPKNYEAVSKAPFLIRPSDGASADVRPPRLITVVKQHC